MANRVVDQKNALTVGFWGVVNKIVCAIHFRQFQIKGQENLPKSGPYLLIANHSSRWDPLVLMHLINARMANYMTHPNELKGFQGFVLRSVGAFPADPRNFTLRTNPNLCTAQIVSRRRPVLIYCNTPKIPWIGIPGAKRPWRRPAHRINPYWSASGIPPVIGVTSWKGRVLRTARRRTS